MKNAHKRLNQAEAAMFEAGVQTMAHIDVAPLTGPNEQLQPKGCDVAMIKGGGAEGAGGVSFWMNANIWAECQGRDDGGCCFHLSRLLTVAHVRAMGE